MSHLDQIVSEYTELSKERETERLALGSPKEAAIKRNGVIGEWLTVTADRLEAIEKEALAAVGYSDYTEGYEPYFSNPDNLLVGVKLNRNDNFIHQTEGRPVKTRVFRSLGSVINFLKGGRVI